MHIALFFIFYSLDFSNLYKNNQIFENEIDLTQTFLNEKTFLFLILSYFFFIYYIIFHKTSSKSQSLDSVEALNCRNLNFRNFLKIASDFKPQVLI